MQGLAGCVFFAARKEGKFVFEPGKEG